jgi:hypothetical protein
MSTSTGAVAEVTHGPGEVVLAGRTSLGERWGLALTVPQAEFLSDALAKHGRYAAVAAVDASQ